MIEYSDSDGREITEGFYTFSETEAHQILIYIEKKPSAPVVVHSPHILTSLTSELASKLKRIHNDQIRGYLNSLEEQLRFGCSMLEKISQSQAKLTLKQEKQERRMGPSDDEAHYGIYNGECE